MSSLRVGEDFISFLCPLLALHWPRRPMRWASAAPARRAVESQSELQTRTPRILAAPPRRYLWVFFCREGMVQMVFANA
jgi:hypothetical protein